MWDDIAILARYLLMLSFNNSLDGKCNIDRLWYGWILSVKSWQCHRNKNIIFGKLKWFIFFYPLANEVAKGYSNASFRPSFRNILVNTLESTSFNGF